MENSPKVIVVVGPTASGKSDFAVELAQKVRGEIISADSRQVYRGLDIGTGKITREEMKDIPHHMLDVASLSDEFSVAEYARLARPIMKDIISRGKTPIICGGTGQYIDALIFNTTTPAVPPNHAFREVLEKKSEEDLYAELLEKDPIRAKTIDRNNKRRLVRALEIISLLGHVPQQEKSGFVYDTELYLMDPSREVLRKRITERLEKRLANGMIEEVKGIMDKGFDAKQMKRFGLEYEIIGDYLEGHLSEETMKEKLVTKSMQYARRQTTWNKKYLPFAMLVDVQ